VVLDTKWKNLNGYNPSPNDLRQMYVYHEYYKAKRVVLIYPGREGEIMEGSFIDPVLEKSDGKECYIFSINVEPKVKEWQRNIFNKLETYI